MPYKIKYVGKVLNGFEILDSYRKHTQKSGNTMYLVRCIHCGKEQEKYSCSVINGTAKCSCQSERKRLGDHQRRLYGVWKNMLSRCENQFDRSFDRYGKRGIRVCDEWHNFYAFYSWAISSGYEEGLTIDRRDNDGNYEPGNCHWATIKEQNNNSTNCRFIEYKGEKMTIAKLSEISGIPYSALYQRIRSGWDIDDAVSIEAKKGNNQNTRKE